MNKLYIKQEDNNFKVFENDNFIGFAEAKAYSKDQKFGIIYKLPKNSLGRDFVSAGKMKDGLELEPHVEKAQGTSSQIKDNYAIFDKIKDNISQEDLAILDRLKAKYIKALKIAELQRQKAELEKLLEELGQ